MSAKSPQRTPNPHLGAYYGIIASAFVSLVVILAMFEQLGWSDDAIARGMILLPLGLYLFIAAGSQTLNVEDFFASGRRVPPVYNALVLAATTVGGIGFFAYTGTVFFIGFDALAIGLGWTCGLLLVGVLFVPYLRKAGAYTLPSFLGQRFRSREIRLVASVLRLSPTALLLAAEVKIAAVVASIFLPLSFSLAVLLVALLVAATGILGGMRALTWTGGAEFVAGAVGLAVPLIVVSVLLTNLPAPQFTYGEMFSSLHNAEITAEVPPAQHSGEEVSALPGTTPKPIAKPFLQPFGAIGQGGFVALFLCFAFGTASLPSLLVRSGVTRSVSDQRRSTAWALALVALFVITAPSVAVFAKLLMFRDMALAHSSVLPSWLTELSGRQLVQAGDINGDGTIGAGELLIARDGIALALPMLAELPYILTVLMAAAGMAIALAAAGSHLFTLAGSLSDDLYRVLDRRPTALPRLIAAWAAIAASALAVVVFLLVAEVDPLRAAVTAFAFAASTFFPVLLLAIWWPRCTAWGALAAMGTGFLILLVEIMVGGLFAAHTAVATAVASLIGIMLALAAGVGTSLYGPKPSQAGNAYYEEMRNPEGEAIFDQAQERAAAAANATGR
jgi:cation/acetate symporter